MYTTLSIGALCGEMGVDFWQRAEWKRWLAEHECVVLTPQLLLDALRHGFVAVRPHALVSGDLTHCMYHFGVNTVLYAACHFQCKHKSVMPRLCAPDNATEQCGLPHIFTAS